MTFAFIIILFLFVNLLSLTVGVFICVQGGASS